VNRTSAIFLIYNFITEQTIDVSCKIISFKNQPSELREMNTLF